ncbi:hypothetical protein CF327_g1955 [Tilletia walkeri]|nr:hypothetical protein CF327_g1955 [Tilletia walkeri]
MEHQRRIHHHHALAAARPQNRRRISPQNQDLLSNLQPRLADLFGPPDNTDNDPAPTKGNSGGNSGGNNNNHSGGNGNGKPTPHDPTDPTSDAGDDNSDTGDNTTTTSTRTPKPTPTPTPTSTSTTRTTTTTTRTTTTETERTTRAPTITSTTNSAPTFTFVVPSQNTQYVQVSPTPDPASSGSGSGSSDSANASTGSSRAGPIIGIIAGVLVGIALISVIASFLFRKLKNRNEDPYESDPFDRNDFQRHSVMVPNDTFSEEDHHNGAGSPEMAERSTMGGMGSPFLDPTPMGMSMGAAAAGGMAAAGAYDNQSINSRNQGGPRPPTMFARHLEAHSGSAQDNMYSNAPALPPQVGGVYAPGEYTNTVVPAMPPVAAGGYGSESGQSPFMGPGVVMGHANVASPYAHLDRSRSAASQYVDLDRSGSGSSAGGAPAPAGAYRSQSGQGALDSMAEESGEHQYDQYARQQQQGYHAGPGATPQYEIYQQHPYQGQQQQQQHQQQHPAQRAASPDNAEDPYGGLY